jgi:hypothetical protein
MIPLKLETQSSASENFNEADDFYVRALILSSSIFDFLQGEIVKKSVNDPCSFQITKSEIIPRARDSELSLDIRILGEQWACIIVSVPDFSGLKVQKKTVREPVFLADMEDHWSVIVSIKRADSGSLLVHLQSSRPQLIQMRMARIAVDGELRSFFQTTLDQMQRIASNFAGGDEDVEIEAFIVGGLEENEYWLEARALAKN